MAFLEDLMLLHLAVADPDQFFPKIAMKKRTLAQRVVPLPVAPLPPIRECFGYMHEFQCLQDCFTLGIKEKSCKFGCVLASTRCRQKFRNYERGDSTRTRTGP